MEMFRAVAIFAFACTATAIRSDLLLRFQTQANATLLQLNSNYTTYPTEGSGPGRYPWATGDAGGWTCGFWPGLLWRLSNVSSDGSALWWADQANAFTSAIAVNQHNTGTHDVGFMTWGSFGQQYLLTGNLTAAEILVTTSHSLAERFVPSIPAFESWGPLHPPNQEIQVIVDNMMNLQLMFFAGESVEEGAASTLLTARVCLCVCAHFHEHDCACRQVYWERYPHKHGDRSRRRVYKVYFEGACFFSPF
jgi:unsaturated chondroitin disaccharide hydrolase